MVVIFSPQQMYWLYPICLSIHCGFLNIHKGLVATNLGGGRHALNYSSLALIYPEFQYLFLELCQVYNNYRSFHGDIISADGKHGKNIQHRKNKCLGTINQIMQILDSVYFGKYYFEVALVLRSSLLVSSILLNSEAWVNLTDKDLRGLEQTDEILCPE